MSKIIKINGMEDVILVDENDNPIGTMDKMEAHLKPFLHRAFSVFLVNNNNMLIQKRAVEKYHSGGLWANSCCSHPRANRDFMDSVYDRLRFELGIEEKIKLEELFKFVYLSKYNDNLYEHEYDHVLLGQIEDYDFKFNKEEIAEMKWVDISWLKKDINEHKEKYATWFQMCAPKVIDYLENKIWVQINVTVLIF